MRNMQNVRPNGNLFRPSLRTRALIGDKLVLKEDASSFIRSDRQLADAKRLAGALGGDRCGWTQSTCTTILPYLMLRALS